MELFLAVLMFAISVSGQSKVVTLFGKDAGFADGEFQTALINGPFGMCIDNEGIIYIADAENNRIRKVDPEGFVTTFAGSGNKGLKDGTLLTAEFNSPSGICTDNKGNFYVVDFLNQAIRKIDTEGNVTTIAGSGEVGLQDGTGKEVKFNYPRGIVINSKNELFVSDSWNHRIRKITADGTVTTFAGGGPCAIVNAEGPNSNDFGTHKDGPDTTARFHTPCGLAIDSHDNIYVADAVNHMIRKITPEGMVSTLAGNGEAGLVDGTVENSQLNTPTELFVSSDGLAYISDTYNNAIRFIDKDGNISPITGKTEAGYVDGNISEAFLNYPRGIVKNEKTNVLYFIDYNNNRMRAIK